MRFVHLLLCVLSISAGSAAAQTSATMTGRVLDFQFGQRVNQHFFQGRVDANLSATAQAFARYTIDDADQRLPLDYPQFPRAFVSRNQYFTAEVKQASSGSKCSTSSIART